MRKFIIIINGTGGCGKDTFVEYVSEFANAINFSSIDKVKEIATYIGWGGQKTEKDRKFLSDLKKLTTEYNDMSFNSIEEAVEKFKTSDSNILFIHIREPEEIQRAVEHFEALTLLIKREDQEIITSNYSDANVENYDYDFKIINNSLEQLDKDAELFVKNLNRTKEDHER